ncbi:MAG: DUF2971 domain-containing protein [Calditrichaeota bacterium]|nr:MAG: DUF2971 domain-containing protein [Calditrichota bacterium]
MEELPKILYKYRVWIDEKDDNLFSFSENENKIIFKKKEFFDKKRCLTEKEIYFSSPKNFNDPFDCSIPIKIDYENKIGMILNYILIDNRSTVSLEEKIKEGMDNYEKEFPEITKDEHVKENEKKQKNKWDNQFGIFSLSKNKSNILMWSHYSYNHKGFCIGYDSDSLNGKFKEAYPIFIEEVSYTKNFPFLDSTRTKTEKLIIEVLTTKSIDWIYEEEFRAILIGGNRANLNEQERCFKLPISAFKEIIFGCEMSEPHKEEIKEVLRKGKFEVDLYQAKMKKRSFGLDFKQIDY